MDALRKRFTDLPSEWQVLLMLLSLLGVLLIVWFLVDQMAWQ